VSRVLLLVATTSYRTEDFVRAAGRLGVEAVVGTDRCHVLADEWPREAFGSLQLELRDADRALAQIVDEARARPLDAVVPTDDQTAVIAARAQAALGLGGNSPEATYVARNKARLREVLAAAGVPSPRFLVFERGDDPERVFEHVFKFLNGGSNFACVLKPLLLSMSRGVMRADDAPAFVAAWRRLGALLDTPALRAVEDPAGRRILVEAFVPGREVALEGILRGGRLTTLALFDKPDPLDGPFFEETIYVTPSREPAPLQAEVAAVAARAAAAIGLCEGPIHAELRLAPSGPVVIEVAARSIGGLCARTLRFGLGAASLEEIVLRHALGREVGALERSGAAGVMMLPSPGAGVLKAVRGVEAARAVPLVEDVVITARPGEVLVPLPEGASYPGFLFARGAEPSAVEAALRAAHACLQLELAPTLPTR
jgi:biotin carboxylase